MRNIVDRYPNMGRNTCEQLLTCAMLELPWSKWLQHQLKHVLKIPPIY